MSLEDITKRPTAGLTKLDYALMGVDEATQEVLKAFPQLAEKPPAGRSLIEWAQDGLESAINKVRQTTQNV